MSASFFMIAFFTIAIVKPLIFKVCAVKLDHRTAPIFISSYMMMGILISLPFFSSYMEEGLAKLIAHPFIFSLCVLKGIIFWFAVHDGQKLTQVSLSSARYTLPPALAISAVINSFLGEHLTMVEWVSVMGLAILGIAFFLKGHLQELGRSAKILFIKLVLILVSLIVIDHVTITYSNWYVLLFTSNATLLIWCVLKKKPLQLWKTALFSKLGIVAGMSMLTFEFIKFYPMVTLIPVSVISTVQASTIPIVLVLTSLIWGERTWQEQLLWGVLSVAFILPLIFS